MKPSLPSLKRVLMLIPLLLLLGGCKSALQPLPATPVAAPAIPTLPAQARQPIPPPICFPTCSVGLTTLRAQLLDMLTPRGLPVVPASAPTTR